MSRKLSIALVCDPIGSNKSGVVVSTLRFGRLLSERGHRVVFVGSRSEEHTGSHYQGIKTHLFRSLPVPRSGGWRLAFPAVGELKKVFQDEKIDVVHVILPMSGAIAAVKAAGVMGIKVIAHSHSQPENLFMHLPKILQGFLGRGWNAYLAWFYGKTSYILYPTEMARSLLETLSKKSTPSAVVSNGISLDEFRSAEVGDFHERFGLSKEGLKLLFVGRLSPEKSLDTLLKAMPRILAEHPDTGLMIAGTGPSRPGLELLARRLGVGASVDFLGLVSDEDRLHAYNASDIFVFPSLAELEGMAVLEAMACGKPIIVADAPMSASRFFVEGNGFHFKAEDPEDLALQAIKLIADRDLRNSMAGASLEVAKKYDIEESVDKLERVYFSVLNS
ncbi:MAG: hypothetical protein JWN89_177 [Parcubacteria group bacterium]|nr:hypothetical protein [Parcubacteria group bacterium]